MRTLRKRFPLRAKAGSILVIVIVTLMFCATALLVFLEKASDDLLVESRDADARRLRTEAYSALETVLSVLNEFKTVNGSLKSPAEGWSDPLNWASYEPSAGCSVRVEFRDESGKLSLPKAKRETLVDLFKSWELPQLDAERLADALLYWMQHDYVPTTSVTPTYELDSLPSDPPGRPLRSMSELAAVDVVRDFFFDDNGRPNEFWRRFTENVSLFDFPKTNLNSATSGALASAGLDVTQQSVLADYLSGTGRYMARGPGYFKDTSELASVVTGDVSKGDLGTEISALRIIVTVQQGRAIFMLNAVVTSSGNGGAKVVTTQATHETLDAQPASEGNGPGAKKTASAKKNKQSKAGEASMNYPFTVLEISENDEIPQPVTQASDSK